jgi:Family of unknown function (DUF5335)
MSTRHPIDRADWPAFFVRFSNANQGRPIAVIVHDPRLGRSCLNDGVPLLAMDYDPAGRGDDIVISIGQESVEATHLIRAPSEVAEMREEDGTVAGLEVVDRSEDTTRLVFTD